MTVFTGLTEWDLTRPGFRRVGWERRTLVIPTARHEIGPHFSIYIVQNSLSLLRTSPSMSLLLIVSTIHRFDSIQRTSASILLSMSLPI